MIATLVLVPALSSILALALLAVPGGAFDASRLVPFMLTRGVE
jgi:hypothetical protein